VAGGFFPGAVLGSVAAGDSMVRPASPAQPTDASLRGVTDPFAAAFGIDEDEIWWRGSRKPRRPKGICASVKDPSIDDATELAGLAAEWLHRQASSK
jgi:hypothetical protein